MRFFSNSPVGWALVFVVYGFAATGAAWLRGVADLPEIVQNLLTVIAAPLFVLAVPFLPLLRRFNLVVTAYWSYPKLQGLIIVIVLWAVVIVVVGSVFRKGWR